MAPVRPQHDGARRPPVGGSLAYLLMNLPLGVFWFVLLLTLSAVGIGTAVIWVGVPILALAVLLTRGGAHLERARSAGLLGVGIETPYRSLPEGGQRERWKARLRDGATWRDLAYLLLLFPLGVVEFVLVVVFWSVGLALLTLPIYFRFLPEGAHFFPAYDVRWITVDSTLAALPWAAMGALVTVLAMALTRTLARGHVRFARALLGPVGHRTEAAARHPHPARPVSEW
ncbi:Putative sensor [Amycolatopsis arida]|uniref:Putative sensor n=1 Tax=Amycolatopsis arida TaxID=587909 RepID=A0A1I5MK90_9PSEU|nr:sensor domain-containing protein [Amycolatopsis arida]TDX94123.1 putative sensor protein [Amycolatopsis arida]SFP09959.1 Putative sensor [Amycolatopsis arida]